MTESLNFNWFLELLTHRSIGDNMWFSLHGAILTLWYLFIVLCKSRVHILLLVANSSNGRTT